MPAPRFLPLLRFLGLFSNVAAIHAASPQPVAQWSFEDATPGIALESVSTAADAVTGYAQRGAGVQGQALRLDGYTTGVTHPANAVPKLGTAFTFEAWVALEAYPWGLCPILSQVRLPDTPVVASEGMAAALAKEEDPQAGYFFGVDANGHALLQVAIGGQWITGRSEAKLPLLRWNHIVGILDPDTQALRLYLNGHEVAHQGVNGTFTPEPAGALLIGRNPKPRPPQHPIRLNLPALYALEGLLDEVKVYDRALSVDEVQAAYASTPAPEGNVLAFAPLPGASEGPVRFGAWTTRLTYKDTWDAPRREGPASDVVVRFDEHPWQYLFWRGTNYIPHWVTENGIWYTNEFNETWNNGALGCAEPMSDKQARFSRVQILESGEARVVIHWRYALVDTRYVSPLVDPLSGWGEWTDEYHTIYPDGVGVRRIQLWSSQPQQPHEFQESIVLIPAGKRPEEVIATEAVTLINLRGDAHTYSWADRPPERTDLPEGANIELIHTRSQAKPFLIVSDAPFELYGQWHPGPVFKPFNAEVKREHSLFPWWNHWPVAQIPSDGRWATEPDRVAHSSLTTGLEWKDSQTTPNSRTRLMLHGLTEGTTEELAQIGRSWLRAPQATIAQGGRSIAYDEAERAYVVDGATYASGLGLVLSASADHPLVNPAFILRGCDESPTRVRINGKQVSRGKDFRTSVRRGLTGDDLIVWLRITATDTVDLQFSAQGP